MRLTGSRLLSGRPQMWVCVVACLFVVDFVLCGYVPAQKRLNALREARTRQIQMVAAAAAQEAELPALRKRLDKVRRTATRYDTSVPRERALGGFLQQIATIMSRHNLTDHMVAPRAELEGPSQTCIPLEVTCRGTLVDLFEFFRDMQSLDRLVRIEKVMLNNSSDLDGWVNLRMEAAIFYQDARDASQSDTAKEETTGVTSNDA